MPVMVLYIMVLILLEYNRNWYNSHCDKGESIEKNDLIFIANYLDNETIKALSNFLRNTSFGTFTLIIQENKVDIIHIPHNEEVYT